ncbi:MarR family winged helix-turn-helix transcriptional regulator [Streptomyces sp. HUAS MG91]|uniref:MarR family winged helix-turn-helix transcriptional regulator n=1 Tax=Streptomyces tabacisoli TaxID=3156398 RepID=A0AAU8IP55_9ACTN
MAYETKRAPCGSWTTASEGVVARGFDGLRPVHGFAFSRLSAGDATATELAAHLGVTQQAASRLVDEMVRKGYVERQPHPHDARARLLVLTERGRACTRAAEEAAGDAVLPWVERLGEGQVRALAAQLLALAPGGPVRPIW